MARVVVTSVPDHRHFGPMRTIAADLVRRGHRVTVLTGEDFRGSVRLVGAEFAPLFGQLDQRTAELVGSAERLAQSAGLPRLAWDLRHLVVDTIADRHGDLCRLLGEDDEPAVIVGDVGFYGTLPLAYGAPGPRPAAILHVGTVPFALDGAEQLGEVQQAFVDTMRALGVTAEKLPFLVDAAVFGVDRFLQLSIEELSHPRDDTPDHVEFVGTVPVVEAAHASKPEWWPEVEAAERVVVVTQGTVEDFGYLIEPTLRAVADLPVLVVAATGREGEIGDVPANARVTSYIPFDDLLPHADVLVTNGGFAGVQQALTHSTPLVLAGQTEGNLRITSTGAAINLATPTVEQIRDAVQAVLAESVYRDNAARLAAEYARLDALGSISKAVSAAQDPFHSGQIIS